MILWTFVGALSHILVDIFNSYGAKVLLPLSRKMITFNLLMIFDPILIGIFAPNLLFQKAPFTTALISFVLLSFYFIFRWHLKIQVRHYLARKFRNRQIGIITVMPSNYSIFGWDFLVETSQVFCKKRNIQISC